MRFAALLLLTTAPLSAQDAAAVMSQVAANVEKAVDARRQYVYQQAVRASLSKTNGRHSLREKRQYTVIPSPTGAQKKLVSWQGEYRKGKQSFTYDQPPKNDPWEGVDAQVLGGVTDSLINDQKARDGIPPSLFPLQAATLTLYSFHMKGEFEHQGRRTYRIAFEPSKEAREMCADAGDNDDDDDCSDAVWKGEAWIDATELEPVRIDTHLAYKVPWAVRTFLGTNLKQTGFSITYQRVAPGVWFPATYGTEFEVDVLFVYKRTIAINLESTGFQKTDATSTIRYGPPAEKEPR